MHNKIERKMSVQGTPNLKLRSDVFAFCQRGQHDPARTFIFHFPAIDPEVVVRPIGPRRPAA